jgi:hypothetical protein
MAGEGADLDIHDAANHHGLSARLRGSDRERRLGWQINRLTTIIDLPVHR